MYNYLKLVFNMLSLCNSWRLTINRYERPESNTVCVTQSNDTIF